MDKKERYLWSLKRKGKGITQLQIAEAIGYSESMINKFERGRRDMLPERLEQYKKYIEDAEVDFE